MAWCYEHLRDCKEWADEGLMLSTVSNEAAKLCDCIQRLYITWTDTELCGGNSGGIEQAIKQLRGSYPDCLMGQILDCGLTAVGTATSILIDDDFNEACNQMQMTADCSGNEREKLHVEAIMQFVHGNLNLAAQKWEKLLNIYPNDMLAVKFAHDSYFYLGSKKDLRDSAAKALKHVKPATPCSSYLYGMYAFGLEECGDYAKAEEQARKGLSLNVNDTWAIHAIAHCMEMTGQFNEGIRFMESTIKNWEPCELLACHNFWHTALYYVEKQDYETALSYYDSEIAKRVKNGLPLEIVDAASMLFRLDMEGVNVGKRWNDLISVVVPRMNDHILTFNDAHYRMVLEKYSGKLFAKQHRESIQKYLCKSNPLNDSESYRLLQTLGVDILESISDYSCGKYNEVVQRLYPIRHQLVNIGGSDAQRDVFTQLLIQSGIRSSKPELKQWARNCIDERKKIKCGSLISERLCALLEKSCS